MTARFKLGLTALAVLALACLAILLFKEDAPSRHGGDGLIADDPTDPATPGGPGLHTGGRDPGAPGTADDPGTTPTRVPGLVPGMREPHGIDYSRPEVRQSELDRLLRASEIDWKAVGKLLALMNEPVSDDLRSILLQELKTGRRNMVMHAFGELRDPSFVEDLFEVFDDPEAARGARAAALQALWKMPGADSDTVALALESRLAGELGKDRELLYGLAARGGVEATRALVEYLGRSKQLVPSFILQKLNLADNPEAAAVVIEALKKAETPELQTALVDMAGRPGVPGLTTALIDLDTDAQKPQVRSRVLLSLARVGDEAAVDYLLRRAEEPGEFGVEARNALKSMYSANPGARSKLTKALESAGLNPQPDAMKESLLYAVGTLKHKPAMRGVARYLDDPSPRVRLASVKALGGMGPDARPHVNRMRGHYQAGDVGMKIQVAIAFGGIGGETAIRALEGWIGEKDNTPSLDRTLKMSLRAARDALDRQKKRAGK